MPGFRPANPSLFFSRKDTMDPRLGDIVKPVFPSHTDQDLDIFLNGLKSRDCWLLAGYPDEEGIRINGGRQGAKDAPDAIRKYLYKMTPANERLSGCFDLGDLNLELPLEARHEDVKSFARKTLLAGHRWIGLGGGHDYGYPDAAAFIHYCEKLNVRPLVLNFDAHLDVRPTDRGLSSGTPFFRMLEEFADRVDFAEIGIQSQCNSRAHWDWALQKKARILSLDEILMRGESLATQVEGFLKPWLKPRRPAFISIDIDGFKSASAPGCSQSWATGMDPNEFCQLLNRLQHVLDVRMVGIYEVSPPLDFDEQTAKLAALLVHRFLFNL